VAVALKLNPDNSCETAGVGITGVAAKAYRAANVENTLAGKQIDEAVAADAAAHACDGAEINGDLYASAEYRKHLAQVYTRRGIQTALAQAS
jgi:carbon-monoxide dehydrogenase medium subunit